MNPVTDFLRQQQKAWLDRRQEWALHFLDGLMQDVARYNSGAASREWIAHRMLRHSYRLAEKADEVRATRLYLPADGKELNLWLEGLQNYRFGLRELEVYLSQNDPVLVEQARRAFGKGSFLLAGAMAQAYARLGFQV